MRRAGFGVAVLLFTTVGVLAWLAVHQMIGIGTALTLGIVATIIVFTWDGMTNVCPRCKRALYVPNRSRCRVCGFDLRGA